MRIVLLKHPGEMLTFCEKICVMAEKLEYDIAAILSLDKHEQLTSLRGCPVCPLREIIDLSWDVAVCAFRKKFSDKTIPGLRKLKIGQPEQFKDCFWLLQQFMIKKYEDSADPIIQATIAYWQTHELSVFNQHLADFKDTADELFIDKDCNTLAPLLDIIVRRRSLNRYRYDLVRKKHSAGSLDDPDNWSAQAASSALAEDPAERMVNNAVLVKAVQALPDTERMAFYGKYVIGYTDAELAHMLGQKQGSIRCCLSRARRKIKAYLKEEGYFE